MTNDTSVIHPGKLLLSELTKRGMKQKELAIRTGMSEKHVSTVINGAKDLSISFAHKLDIALGDESGTWARHQADYDSAVAILEEQSGITDEENAIFKGMKEIVDFFLDIGVMRNYCGSAEKIIQLRKILCVNSLTVIPQITYNAAYRAQVKTSTNIDPYILFAWQRLCEIQTENIVINEEFNPERLKQSFSEIKKLMFEHNAMTMVNNLKAVFAECGVAFDVVQHFRGAPVQGFIKKTDSGRVILCVTIRGKNADRFWFSLFHEIGHLLNGDLSARFVDFDTVKTEMEDKADSFARDALINPDSYRKMLASGNYNDLTYIKEFAEYEGVPYWIVIGRLHSDEWLDWSYFAHETPSFEWKKK